MAYKTYTEQLTEHLHCLQSHGLDITEIKIDSDWIRCRPLGVSQGRGELAYIATTEKLNNGLFGIKTSFRGLNGSGKYSTYGLWPNENEKLLKCPNLNNAFESKAFDGLHKQAALKAYGFWNHSNTQGKSEYLDRKGVGYYGIRFRQSEQYGNVAIVPMFDEIGKLWSYQILNPDGTKRHPKDARTQGLFHKLRELENGKPIGIAESYVTSATCMELSGISVVCAFSSENLITVTKNMLSLFPTSPIIIFADNDRHLEEKGMANKGVLKAQEAKKINETRVMLSVPNFDDCEPSKEASDWNDLFKLKGFSFAKAQIENSIGKLLKR